jgi:hypothetical protein
MKRLFLMLTTLLLAGGLVTSPVLAGGYTKQKVVYHVNGDDAKQQTGALRNIQNHINAVGAENLDLKVVMHGNGVSLVMVPEAVARVKNMKAGNATPQMQASIDNLRGQGVKFEVCANTLKGRNISRENDLYMVEETDIVPSGVAELAHLQSQGYTYIKP